MDGLLYDTAASAAILLACHAGACLLTSKLTARWFAVHALSNLVVAVCTAPNARALCFEPRTLLLSSEALAAAGRHELLGNFPLALAIYTHLYHAACYPLSRADRLHHAVFLPTIAAPGYAYDWGALGRTQLFFICGLPGAIIYALLALERCASVRLGEPAVAGVINALVRAPGTLAANALLVVAYANGTVVVPAWAAALQLLLAPTNAVYYAHASVVRARRLS
jgi:hypothetical protein